LVGRRPHEARVGFGTGPGRPGRAGPGFGPRSPDGSELGESYPLMCRPSLGAKVGPGGPDRARTYASLTHSTSKEGSIGRAIACEAGNEEYLAASAGSCATFLPVSGPGRQGRTGWARTGRDPGRVARTAKKGEPRPPNHPAALMATRSMDRYVGGTTAPETGRPGRSGPRNPAIEQLTWEGWQNVRCRWLIARRHGSCARCPSGALRGGQLNIVRKATSAHRG